MNNRKSEENEFFKFFHKQAVSGKFSDKKNIENKPQKKGNSQQKRK